LYGPKSKAENPKILARANKTAPTGCTKQKIKTASERSAPEGVSTKGDGRGLPNGSGTWRAALAQ
jgi:hypothetical protein